MIFNLFKRKTKIDIESAKKDFIQQFYGHYNFGDEVEDDEELYYFVCIEQGYALLIDKETRKLRYMTINEEKLIKYLTEKENE